MTNMYTNTVAVMRIGLANRTLALDKCNSSFVGSGLSISKQIEGGTIFTYLGVFSHIAIQTWCKQLVNSDNQTNFRNVPLSGLR